MSFSLNIIVGRLLILASLFGGGDILELGAGLYSTPLLHNITQVSPEHFSLREDKTTLEIDCSRTVLFLGLELGD